jgi:hypothetical protein
MNNVNNVGFFAMKGMGLLTSKLPYQETDDDQPMDLGVPD